MTESIVTGDIWLAVELNGGIDEIASAMNSTNITEGSRVIIYL